MWQSDHLPVVCCHGLSIIPNHSCLKKACRQFKSSSSTLFLQSLLSIALVWCALAYAESWSWAHSFVHMQFFALYFIWCCRNNKTALMETHILKTIQPIFWSCCPVCIFIRFSDAFQSLTFTPAQGATGSRMLTHWSKKSNFRLH